MSWRQDREKVAGWLVTSLLGVTVGLLCYEANAKAEDLKQNASDDAALKAQVDYSAGKAEVQEQLLKEVRDDVKELLRRSK